jgi:hypothetical protein
MSTNLVSLKLNDEQMDALVRIAAPLTPTDRRLFLEDVARALNGHEVGDGLLHRVAVECQRKYWSPNALDGKVHGGKYR